MADSRFAKGDRVVRRGTAEPVYEVTRAGDCWPYAHVRHVPTEYMTDCVLEDTLVHAPPLERASGTSGGSLLQEAVARQAPERILTSTVDSHK